MKVQLIDESLRNHDRQLKSLAENDNNILKCLDQARKAIYNEVKPDLVQANQLIDALQLENAYLKKRLEKVEKKARDGMTQLEGIDKLQKHVSLLEHDASAEIARLQTAFRDMEREVRLSAVEEDQALVPYKRRRHEEGSDSEAEDEEADRRYREERERRRGQRLLLQDEKMALKEARLARKRKAEEEKTARRQEKRQRMIVRARADGLLAEDAEPQGPIQFLCNRCGSARPAREFRNYGPRGPRGQKVETYAPSGICRACRAEAIRRARVRRIEARRVEA